jgi:beta-lactamase regulating signal transducer with metallopeptidase domain
MPVGAASQEPAAAQVSEVPRLASASLLGSRTWAQMESHNTDVVRRWNFASAFLLCWVLANVVRVAHAVSSARRKSGSDGQITIVDGISVVVTDSIGPATVGFWRSHVLVPQWVFALPQSQRQYVLRHEEEHRSAHDARILFAASLLTIVVPWNLALWWQLRRLYLAVEIDCDNRVVNRLGDANAYGELLLKVAQAATRGPRLQPALLGGMGSLERRLTALLEPAPLRHLQRILLPALALGLLFLVLLVPHPVLEHASHVHVTAATTTALESHPQH